MSAPLERQWSHVMWLQAPVLLQRAKCLQPRPNHQRRCLRCNFRWELRNHLLQRRIFFFLPFASQALKNITCAFIVGRINQRLRCWAGLATLALLYGCTEASVGETTHSTSLLYLNNRLYCWRVVTPCHVKGYVFLIELDLTIKYIINVPLQTVF